MKVMIFVLKKKFFNLTLLIFEINIVFLPNSNYIWDEFRCYSK